MVTHQGTMIAPGEGHAVDIGGVGAVYKLSGADTGGSFSVVEHPLDPGALAAPPHIHVHEDEYSYVIEGEVGFLIGDEEFHAPRGSYVLKPRGVIHTFWNRGQIPARILEVISPAGFERFFEELAEVVYATPSDGGAGEPDDVVMSRVIELGKSYGLTFAMERVPYLLEKYRLTLR